MDWPTLLFYLLAVFVVVFSFFTVTHSNPIFCALCLAVSMIGLAFLFFTLQAYFIGAVQLIVYAGAVLVLFVMVLMLFDLKTEIRAFSKGAVLGVLKIASAALLAAPIIAYSFFFPVQLGTEEKTINTLQVNDTTSTVDLAVLLFSKYLFAFEALGVLLLLVAVGVVAVSRIKGGTHAQS